MFPDFEIRKLIGRGGMGAVYEAWQKSLARPIAVKLLPPELLLSQDFFERFQREARIMAQMDHLNVARVYGSGISDEGEPYIVMEFVAGEPITTYARRQELNLKEKLNLFLAVCSGVQHAHQKGIIHRDLKPSNILVAEVEGRAVPKVIDFGLAKPLEQSSGDEAVWLSARHAVGTPSYMSPEQASGEDIDSRSDIYSLGALLYELLTGRKLLDDDSLLEVTRSTIEATIRETSVPRPSDGVLEHGGAKPLELRGDLDAIVLKALDKRPARRYETVAALADDIRRHFAHRPVLAVRPYAPYLLKKFCRRHRTGLVIATGFVVLVFVGLGLIVRGSVQARRAEQLAEERLRQGERLIDFMLGDLHGKLETVGRLDVLEAAVGEVERFYARPAPTNPPAESLRNRGRAMFRLGQIRNAQGASSAAKRHYEEAINIYGAAIARRPELTAWKEELGRTWNSLAVFHHQRGEWVPAEAAYREAIQLAAGLLDAEPDHPDWVNFKASLLHNFGSLCEANARLDEAEASFTRALGLWENLQARAPDDRKLIENLSHLYLNLAFLKGRQGHRNEANESNVKALRLRERLVELDPGNARALCQLADIQQCIAEVHINYGELAEAEAWLNRYRPVREQLAARDPANAGWQRSLADAWHNFAVLQARRDNLDAAGDAHRKAWDIAEAQLSAAGPGGMPRLRWIEGLQASDETFARLVQRENERGHWATAQRHGKTLVEIRAKLANEKPNDAPARHRLAVALLDLAATSLAVADSANALHEARLALLLLEHGRAAGLTNRVGADRWKTLCELAGIPKDAPLYQTENVESLRNVWAGATEEGAIKEALASGSIQLPPAFATNLLKLATHPRVRE